VFENRIVKGTVGPEREAAGDDWENCKMILKICTLLYILL
jgi:hypothetical protein